MAIATVVILPLGLLFIISGLTVNVFQALLFVLVRPISKSIYRRINKEVTELLWMQFVWLFDWWANIKVELYIDPETYELLGKENAVIISNHRSDIDWLVEFILAQRAGCLGNTLALAKKPLFYIPILGWSMWFAGFIVIEGNWAKDERKLQVCSNCSAIFFGVRTSLQCICCIYFVLLLSLTAVRFQRAKRFPKTILVGRFLRRHSFYPGKSFSSARVCCFGWIASPKERFDSSYQGLCYNSKPFTHIRSCNLRPDSSHSKNRGAANNVKNLPKAFFCCSCPHSAPSDAGFARIREWHITVVQRCFRGKRCAVGATSRHRQIH